MDERPEKLFATIATCDRPDAGVGVVWFAFSPRGTYLLRVVDYSLESMSAINGEWLEAFFAQSAELVRLHRPVFSGCVGWVEDAGLVSVLEAAGRAREGAGVPDGYDIERVRDSAAAAWPATIDERVAQTRALVNSGTVVRIESGLRRFAFRGTKTDHLVAQLRRHRRGDAASAGELLHVFVLALLLTRESDERVTLPPFASPEPAPEGLWTRMLAAMRASEPKPKRPPEPTPGVMLAAGKHTIQWHQISTGGPWRDDGFDKTIVTIDIAGERGQQTWHPLPRWGCYLIDSRITHVRDTSRGAIQIA